MLKKILPPLLVLAVVAAWAAPAAPARKILFFTKSSGFEHSVISWKNGRPSAAEKTLLELGAKNGWEFTFSKDGSLFSKEYLAQFDSVMFYTTGDLTTPGTDGQPPLSEGGKQALFDYVKAGHGFVGTHSATDTFHTGNESSKGPERFLNHGAQADSYVKFIGGEFIIHGAQQVAKSTVIDRDFPGFAESGPSFDTLEEWYSLKDFSPDLHVIAVLDAPAMSGTMYQRPAYPVTWARAEGSGRVFYTAMGHREDVWTSGNFRNILTGALRWANGEVSAAVAPNLAASAPGAATNPLYQAPAAPKTVSPSPGGAAPAAKTGAP